MLTKEQILGANDLVKESVGVPEWGGEVWVRGMTGSARSQYEESIYDANHKGIKLFNIHAKLAAAAICDESGKLLFSQHEIEQLGQKSACALDRIAEVALRLSRLRAEDVDDLRGN